MSAAQRLLFWLLRLLDEVWPGWAAPKPAHADYLSRESYAFWMTRHGRRGDA